MYTSLVTLTKTKKSSNIDELPDDLLIRIFEQLNAAERIRMERVCKKWNNLSLRSWTKYNFIDDNFCKSNNVSAELTKTGRSEFLKEVLSRGGMYIKSLQME